MAKNRALLVAATAELGGIKVVAHVGVPAARSRYKCDSFAGRLVREDEG